MGSKKRPVKFVCEAGVVVKGKVPHTEHDVRRMCKILVKLHNTAGISSNLVVRPAHDGDQLESADRGVEIIGPVGRGYIKFAFQPTNKGRRFLYVLLSRQEYRNHHIAMLEKASTILSNNKAVATEPHTEDTQEKENPMSYAKDPEWVKKFIQTAVARSNEGVISKDDVTKLIIELTDLEQAFRTGPIHIGLRNRGWLTFTDVDKTMYKVNSVPVIPEKKGSKPKKAKKVIKRKMPMIAKPFLKDSQKLALFFETVFPGEVQHTTLVTAALRTQYGWSPQQCGHVLAYMLQRGWLYKPRDKYFAVNLEGVGRKVQKILDPVGINEPVAPVVSKSMPDHSSKRALISSDQLEAFKQRFGQMQERIESQKSLTQEAHIEVADLKDQVAALQAENDDLRAQLPNEADELLAEMDKALTKS